MPIRLIAGLGNPGRQYAETRHNAGFMLLERFDGSWKDWRSLGQYTDCSLGDSKVFLIRPMTFMNDSGRMLGDYCGFHRIVPSDTLIVFDDWSLPLGRCRLRRGGSAGGHNGMKSVIDVLGTEEIPRLRIGIGPLPAGRDPAQFVLSPFSKAERAEMENALDKSFEMVRDCVAFGVDEAMNRHNSTGA